MKSFVEEREGEWKTRRAEQSRSSTCLLVGDVIPVQDDVVIEQTSETTISFQEGSTSAYLGHVTVRFNPDKTSPAPHQQHYAIQVEEEGNPHFSR